MSLGTQSSEGLCVRFDNDIRFDAHGLALRVGRSEALQELLNRGRPALRVVAAFVRAHTSLDELDLRTAWGMLFNEFKLQLQVDGRVIEYDDTAGWLTWADSMLTEGAA